MAGAQRAVQTPAQRAQLQFAAHLQRPVALIVPLRVDHAALRLRASLQFTQHQLAFGRAHGGPLPPALRLQLQRPAALQQYMIDRQLQLAQRRAPVDRKRNTRRGEIGMQPPAFALDATLRRAPHGSGEIRLRSVEGQLHLQPAEQRAARQLPAHLSQPSPIGTQDVTGSTVPNRALHLLQPQPVQLRLDPRHHPARRQKPRQHQHDCREHRQGDENFSKSNQASSSECPAHRLSIPGAASIIAG